MIAFVLSIILFLGLLVMIVLTYGVGAQRKTAGENEQERLAQVQGWLYAGIVAITIGILASVYLLVKGTSYEGHLLEWLNIVVRVMHFTFGIAWIGASFYFVFLENSLNRTDNIRDELAGNLWAVHGGGFYYLEKYKVAPRSIPKHLHWFKYEAYFTWISGFALLFIVYYFNASAMMIDPAVMTLTTAQAVAISAGSFVVAWLIYDLLCKSSLVQRPLLFSLTGLALLFAFAWGYSQLFSGRAAFIHFGAMIGSIMVANVFFVIIPAQKSMVKAAKRGELPDAARGQQALRRSIHNNYFTFPVLFVMVSNHFPSTFGNRYQWLVLGAISLGAAGIKHWLNLREQGRLSLWIMPASVIILLAVAYATAPPPSNASCREVGFAEVNMIIQKRCVSCHSSRPTDPVYTAPPNGVKYDTPLEITAKKELILQRVVLTRTMPQNNKTNMTPEERDLIRCWIEQGANTR
jgi:uncharacterized membrane protein